jgi:molybdopterin-binding protein
MRGAVHRVSRPAGVLTRFAMIRLPGVDQLSVVTGESVARRGLTVGNDVAAVADVD